MDERGWIYIIASRWRGAIYIGVTGDLPARIVQHRERAGSRHAAKYGIDRLVWAEPHDTMLGAIAREKAIKKWQRAWKIELIETANPEWADLFETLNA